MSNLLAVLVDGQAQLEFNREVDVPAQHLAYLDNMDAKMDGGIVLEGDRVAEPDMEQRARFVALNMATALASGNESMAMGLCTWLGVRRPELKQVKITGGELGLTVDLDHENVYEKPAPEPQVVTFTPTTH